MMSHKLLMVKMLKHALIAAVFVCAVFFYGAHKSCAFAGQSTDNATDLTGVWNTFDSCFPDTPYTLIIEQHAGSVSLASTAGPDLSCSGTLSGPFLTLNCAGSGAAGEAYVMIGTVDNASSLQLSRQDNATHTCTFTKHTGLDPMVEKMLMVVNLSESIQPLGERTPGQMRRYMARSNALSFLFPAAPVASIKNIYIPGPGGRIPVRVYTPHGAGPFPVVVFYHGGGWVLGRVRQFDHFCRLLASKATALVLSVDYRLAPEHVFPAALDDAYAALEWAADNAGQLGGDPARLAVMGESAGGNMAAVVCRMARDQGGPDVRFQVLLCPVTNVSDMSTGSYSQFATGYMLTKEWMEAFRGYYLPESSDWSDTRVSPLLSQSLAGLPPALIITAGYDVLRDDGEAYARRLSEAGVPVKHYRCGGVIHAFTTALVDYLVQAQQAVSLIARDLNRALGDSGSAATHGYH